MKVFSFIFLMLPILVRNQIVSVPGGSDNNPGFTEGPDNHPGSIGVSDNHPGFSEGPDNNPESIGGESDNNPEFIEGSDNIAGSIGGESDNQPEDIKESNKHPEFIGESENHLEATESSTNHPEFSEKSRFGGSNSSAPEYTSIPGFEDCLENYKPSSSYTAKCLPSEKPLVCFDNSWKKIQMVFDGPKCPRSENSQFDVRSDSMENAAVTNFSPTKQVTAMILMALIVNVYCY